MRHLPAYQLVDSGPALSDSASPPVVYRGDPKPKRFLDAIAAGDIEKLYVIIRGFKSGIFDDW